MTSRDRRSSTSLAHTPDVTSSTIMVTMDKRRTVATPSSSQRGTAQASASAVQRHGGRSARTMMNSDHPEPPSAPNTSPVDFHLPQLMPKHGRASHVRGVHEDASHVIHHGQHIRFGMTDTPAYFKSLPRGKAIQTRRSAAARKESKFSRPSTHTHRTEDTTKWPEILQHQQKTGSTFMLGGESVNPTSQHERGGRVTPVPYPPSDNQVLDTFAMYNRADIQTPMTASYSVFGDDQKFRAKSSTRKSVSSRLGVLDDPNSGYGEGVGERQPAHPIMRMYQTRPGAFARMLSRDTDPWHMKVAPGSTIASLMAPHPAVTAVEEEEAMEEFEGCVMGTTVDMAKKKSKDKPPRRFYGAQYALEVMEWRRYQWRAQRIRRKPKSEPKSAEKKEEESDESTESDKKTLPKAALHTLNLTPKQFILSAHNDDAMRDLERSLSDSEVPDRSEDMLDADELRRLDREIDAFSDMDYMVPDHLEELLRQEGVSDQIVDNTMALGRMLNDKAAYLNHLYHIRRRKYLARPSRIGKLPPIGKGRSQGKEDETSPANTVESRRERRLNRQKPWAETMSMMHSMFPTVPNLPKIDVTKSPEETESSEKESEPSEDDSESTLYFRSNAERQRWEQERKVELSNTLPDFEHPRVVLISSNVPRCHSMSKAIRRGDKHIVYIVYDFNAWTPQDILNTVRTELDKYSPGCKPRSLLLMCQGGPGCLYLLKKIVLTPQKLRRVQYQHILEFFSQLGGMMSKIEPDESVIHLLGGQLDNSQGRLLLKEMQRAILPNQVQLHTVDEATELGREAIEFYFDFRKFLLWRSKADSQGSLDYTDITRSWSSLAEAVEDMDVS